MKTNWFLSSPLPCVIFLSIASLSGLSAQTSWTGQGDGTSWSDANNWTNGLPSTSNQAQFPNGSLADAPISINLDAPQTARAFNFRNSGSRTITFSGSQLSLVGDAGITWNTSSPGSAAIIVNSNVDFSSATPGSSATWQFGSSQPITINGNITTSGTGARPMQITGTETQVVTINGSNAASSLSFGGSGELVAGSTSALGAGSVQKTTNSTLSLRSDVNVVGSWIQTTGTPYTKLRISELTPSSTNRTLTINDRIAGSSGAIEWINNINSTGKLILELKYNGATEQSMALITNSSAVVRFAQTSSVQARVYSGLIIGGGSVEMTAGGFTALTAANTYTGTTTLTNNSTLSLSGSGTIQGTSRLNLATGTTFNISAITAAGYTFGSAQTLAGTGTIVTGNKNLTVQGTLAPGNSPGTLNFNLGTGTLFLDSTTSLQFELGTTSDLINLTSGTLDIGSGLIDFDNFAFTAVDGLTAGEYTLFQTTNAILGSLGPVTSGTFDGYFGELEISGNNLLLNVSAIPEPGSLGLLLLGSAVLLLRRKPSAK